MRLIHKPKLHSGGSGALPVTVVYSLRISLGSPRNTNRSSASSPSSRAVVLPVEAPKSKVTGAEVWTNMPHPRLLMKNGIGLYMRPVSTPLASLVQSTTFWPRLSSRVKLSPQPKIFSPGDSEKTAAMLREESDVRRMKEIGRASGRGRG